MSWFIAKIILSAVIISFASWLAGKKPVLAGFIIALPISTLIALVFNYTEYKDPEVTVKFAKSVFFAVPLSLTFFLPFLFANKLKWGFWGIYSSGLLCLTIAYFAHTYIFRK